MLQTVKSSFLFIIIFTMFSAVFAADNNADTKQPETIIHKAGIQVKSALINDGVYSRQQLDSQGNPIDENRRTGTAPGATQYRTAPISTWTTEDYINASPNDRRNALLNMGSYQSNVSRHSQRGATIIGEGGEKQSELRTAPINTWTKEQYLNITPTVRHNAINKMQKEPLVAPGGETNVEQRTKPIGDYSQEELLNITPEHRQKALTSASRSFRVGGRSHNNTTINLDPDSYYYEASWNLYDSTAQVIVYDSTTATWDTTYGAYYYSANQTFSSGAAVAVTLNLLPGSYSVDVWDSYGDGGTSGSVVDADETTLVSWTGSSYSSFGQFGFTVNPPQFDVTVNLDPDSYYYEASWNLYDSTAAAYYYSAAQTFSSGAAISVALALAGGTYSVDVWDSYGDGGTSGSVAAASGDALVSWTSYAYSSFGQFGFSIGLFENTITLDPDSYYYEASWNLYDSTASAYRYATNQTFSSSAAITVTEHLAAGHYSVDVWDSYGDGGTSGSVADANGNELVSWTGSSYSSFGQFGFEVLVPSDAPGLFFSEWIEGSSYNKAIELYNPTEDTIWLDNYAFPNVSNAPTTTGEYEYWNTFDADAYVLPGGVFVLAHPDADSVILQAADMTSFNYFSNGDDGFGLAKGTESSYTVIDWIGDWEGDPGSGWDVAGVSAATKDHTIIRKADVIWGNSSWSSSAGTDSIDSEWTVHDQNYSTNLGGHPDDPCWGNVLVLWGRDSFGDGWHGGGYELTDADGNVVTEGFGPPSGSTAWTQFEDLCVADGVYTLTFNTTSFGSEIQYYMTNAVGDTVLSCIGCMASNSTYTNALGVNAPAVQVSSLDFNGLVLNDSETGELLVSNAGWGAAAAMTLDSVSSSGASISVSATGLPISLGAGGSASVSVTYSPTMAGANEDYVILTHSGPSSPDSVMVSGFGVDAYFYESFDPFVAAPGLPMNGWTILDNNGDADTIPEQYKTWYPYNYSSNGVMVATSVYGNGYWADETMITPLMHTPDVAKLTFKTYDYGQYLDVAYSVDGTTFMDLASVYVDGFWQQHDVSLPEVDSLWVSFTFDPDSGSGYTYLYLDDVKVVPLPSTYIEGFVYDQDTDLALGGVSVRLNGTELTTTGENALFLDSGFEDSSFVGSYLTTTSGWWVYPPELTNFYHTMEGDLIYNDTLGANGENTVSVLEGDRALKMWGQFTGAENYTSIYQETGAVEEGTEMYIGAWAMTAMDNKITGGNTFFVAVNYFDAGWAWLSDAPCNQLSMLVLLHRVVFHHLVIDERPPRRGQRPDKAHPRRNRQPG